jgi:A/G-specific adenine glycosylase
MHQFLLHVYNWYKKNCRNLPWRETTDPYKIWISEIILQQTRVKQGTIYYQKFVEQFPDIRCLAEAKEDEVLKLWQGLGYYTRARNLHATAKYISNRYNGKFPGTYSEILELKGVGPYTAAIIASIAFGESCPALDGNVYRLLARYFGIQSSPSREKGKKEFLTIAREIMPERNPGFHNQALMEFGALQCIPKSPDCQICPLRSSCYAGIHKKAGELPVKTPKPKQRMRYFYYYLIESCSRTWLEKRTGNDIWKNLYQLPLLETDAELTEPEIAAQKPGFLKNCKTNVKSISAAHKHILSHQVIYARLIHLEVNKKCRLNDRFTQIETSDIHSFAIPRLIENLLKTTGVF